MNDPLASIRRAARNLRDEREGVKERNDKISKDQASLISQLTENEVGDAGLVIDSSDKSKGTVYVQQNQGSLVWDEEAILDWLNKKVVGRSALRKKTQSLVFDINKWEALVTSKEIDPKIAKKMQKTTAPPKPFLRFGKKGDESK